jgi:hypothetical protein
MPFHNLFGGRDSEINDRIVRQAVQRRKARRVSGKDGGARLRRFLKGHARRLLFRNPVTASAARLPSRTQRMPSSIGTHAEPGGVP